MTNFNRSKQEDGSKIFISGDTSDSTSLEMIQRRRWVVLVCYTKLCPCTAPSEASLCQIASTFHITSI